MSLAVKVSLLHFPFSPDAGWLLLWKKTFRDIKQMETAGGAKTGLQQWPEYYSYTAPNIQTDTYPKSAHHVCFSSVSYHPFLCLPPPVAPSSHPNSPHILIVLISLLIHDPVIPFLILWGHIQMPPPYMPCYNHFLKWRKNIFGGANSGWLEKLKNKANL